MKKIAILVAMGMEAEKLLARMENPVGKKFVRGSIGQAEVVLYRCGWGMRNAARGMHALVDHCKPDLILNYGVSGGMQPDIRLGETVVALSSFPCSGKAFKVGIAQPTDQALAELAAQALPGARLAPICTSQGLIVNKKRKARIVAKSGTVCCDMETYAAAMAANELGVPLLVIRCISDTLEPTSLLAFQKNGSLAAEKAAAAVERVIHAMVERNNP